MTRGSSASTCRTSDNFEGMRIALVLVIALAATGCAKKSKPAAAPAAQEKKAADPAPGGAADENKGSEGDDDAPRSTGDPCDGGETKSK
jgi:hypothetical protein